MRRPLVCLSSYAQRSTAAFQWRRLPGRGRCKQPGDGYGNVWRQGTGEGQDGDARAQEGHSEKRLLGQEGDEPEAGDRDRLVRSAQGRRQGAATEEIGGEEVIAEKDHRQE